MFAGAEEELGPGGKKVYPGISADIIADLTDCNAMLSQQRKKRQVLLVMPFYFEVSPFVENWNLAMLLYFLLRSIWCIFTIWCHIIDIAFLFFLDLFDIGSY